VGVHPRVPPAGSNCTTAGSVAPAQTLLRYMLLRVTWENGRITRVTRTSSSASKSSSRRSRRCSPDVEASLLVNRPLWSSQDKTVTVPGDYATVQDAIDSELAYLHHHYLKIEVDAGADVSSEDVYIPPASTRRIAYGDSSEDVNLVIDTSDGNSKQIGSVFADGVSGMALAVRNLTSTQTTPYSDEKAGFMASGCSGRVQFVNVSINSSESYNWPVVSYSSNVSLNGLDVSNATVNYAAAVTKHHGTLNITSDITGSTQDSLLEASTGYISVNDNANPLSATCPGDRFIGSNGGVVNAGYVSGLNGVSYDGNDNQTISNGTITVANGGRIRPRPESGSSDTVTTISGGTTGCEVILVGVDGETITIDHGTDNISLQGNSNADLSSESDVLKVYKTPNAGWAETGRSI